MLESSIYVIDSKLLKNPNIINEQPSEKILLIEKLDILQEKQ